MSKSLYELGLDYEKNIALLQQTARDVRAQLKAAERSYDKDRVFFLSRKLHILYEEITDMRVIAEKLKNYYNAGGDAA